MLETGITEYINLPSENIKSATRKASINALVKSIAVSGCMHFEFTLSHDLIPGDEITISFNTEDNLVYHSEEFEESLGYSSELSSKTSLKISAAEPPSINLLSDL